MIIFDAEKIVLKDKAYWTDRGIGSMFHLNLS